MNKENISYVCIIICALVALAIVSIYALEYSQEKTNLKIISDSNLHNGDSFTLRLSDAYNRPIDNKSVEITVTDALGEKTLSMLQLIAAVKIPLECVLLQESIHLIVFFQVTVIIRDLVLHKIFQFVITSYFLLNEFYFFLFWKANKTFIYNERVIFYYHYSLRLFIALKI